MAQIIPYRVVRDIALDVNGDWEVSNGDLQLIGDGPAIIQAIKIALEFFQGEWFLDQSVGIPFWQEVLVKRPDVNQIVGIFRKAILGVVGVQAIESLALTWDKSARQLTVKFAVQANVGLLPGSVTLGKAA